MFTKLNHDLAGRIKFVPTEAEVNLLNEAIREAGKSVQRFRVGAASVNGAAHNTTELHAETSMLLETNGANMHGATVAVARLGKRNDRRCSYPCVSCQNELYRRGFRRLVCIDETGQPVALTL